MKKQVAFISGTRADYGKIKSLMSTIIKSSSFELNLFVTGMHLEKKYGYTIEEIYSSEFKEYVFPYINKSNDGSPDLILANTIMGFSNFIKNKQIDLIVVHGDRPESLAAAIVGSFNNILVAHIEGGEISGTIDEMIRHSTSKLSHFHFVSNSQSKERLIRFGEQPNNIVILGNPDLDILLSKELPELSLVKDRYNITFDKYGIALFHPVTTDNEFNLKTDQFIEALLEIEENLIIIYPNNDLGGDYIKNQIEKKLKKLNKIKIFPSLRFEYYLTLLNNSKFIIGNSSSGIHEAPYFSVPTINIGSRQNFRSKQKSVLNAQPTKKDILDSYQKVINGQFLFSKNDFGSGNSNSIFIKTLNSDAFWKTSIQKEIYENQ